MKWTAIQNYLWWAATCWWAGLALVEGATFCADVLTGRDPRWRYATLVMLLLFGWQAWTRYRDRRAGVEHDPFSLRGRKPPPEVILFIQCPACRRVTRMDTLHEHIETHLTDLEKAPKNKTVAEILNRPQEDL